MSHSRSVPAGARPPVGDACLSDRVLDEVVAELRPAPHEHLDACPRCAGRLAVLGEAAQQDAMAARRAWVAAQIRRRPLRQRGWWWVGAGLGLATAAVVVLGLPPPRPDDRFKGSAMACYVLRDGAVSVARSGDAYRAGDALRCTVTSDAGGHFLLVGVDAAGGVSAYHPYGGRGSVPIAAGAEVPLPGSLVLDDATEPELFLGLLAGAPLTLEEVRRAVQEVGPRGVRDLEALAGRLAQHPWEAGPVSAHGLLIRRRGR